MSLLVIFPSYVCHILVVASLLLFDVVLKLHIHQLCGVLVAEGVTVSSVPVPESVER